MQNCEGPFSFLLKDADMIKTLLGTGSVYSVGVLSSLFVPAVLLNGFFGRIFSRCIYSTKANPHLNPLSNRNNQTCLLVSRG